MHSKSRNVANQIAIVSILPFRSLNSAWNTHMRRTFHLTCWMHVALDDVGCIFTFFPRPSFSKWPFWLQPLRLSSEGRRYPQNFRLHKQCNVQLAHSTIIQQPKMLYSCRPWPIAAQALEVGTKRQLYLQRHLHLQGVASVYPSGAGGQQATSLGASQQCTFKVLFNLFPVRSFLMASGSFW